MDTTYAGSGPSTSYFEGLLGRIRDGDEAARDELIRDGLPRAQRLTRYILRGEFGDVARGLTDHVCSASYEKFAQKLKQGLQRDFASVAEMFAYLGATIRNTAIDEVRTLLGPKFQTQFPRAELPPDCAEGGIDAKGVLTRLRFYEMIEDLPAEQREVLDLRYTYGYNDSEIAQVMGVSRTTVMRLARKALIQLKKDFDDPGPNGKS